MPDFLITGPTDARATVLLAHGAGAPMDNGWLNGFADRLGAGGVRVARFEFGYMAARRHGERRPTPRGESLVGEYREAVRQLQARPPLVIGGKSLGGRVASMAAQALFEDGAVAALVCLGYPFHPPEQPDRLRTAHLGLLTLPVLICQGTRDPFGTREEVAGYPLSASSHVHWLEDGDHDFRPRKSISGRTIAQNMEEAAAAVLGFIASV